MPAEASEQPSRCGHSRFFFCPVCQTVFTPEDHGVEMAYGRAFHVVHVREGDREIWERHPMRPIAQETVRTDGK